MTGLEARDELSADEGLDPEEPTLTSDEYSDAQKDVADKDLLAQTVSLQSAIFNSANFVSVATDAKGVIQIFNVGAQRLLGYTADDVVNKVVPGVMHDPDEIIARAATLSAEFGKAIQPGFEAMVYKASRGIEDVYELTAIRKDGSRFPTTVSVTALRDSDAEIIGYLLISTDNTARNQAALAQSVLDQRLRDQQFYTRSLIESNIDALMMTDTMGIISDVNQQMIALTGRTRDELIGAPCRNFFTDPERADAAIARALTESKVSDYELTVLALNGDETDVSYNAATFYDRDRIVQGVFASARDVTERKRFERALRKTNIELEQADRMKTEFLATMSHELRTPLNAIIGFSEALKDELMGDLTASQREYIGDIYSSGLHLLSLINDILDLSKVEAGMMDVELEPVNVRLLLEESLTIVRDDAATYNLSLAFRSAENLGIALLDRRKVKQIVYNLLSNAVKFTSDHGAVTLTARRIDRSLVGTIVGSWPTHDFPLRKSDDDQFLEIRVDDTGMGIAAVEMSKLFLAFSQLDSTLARKFEGTGLGLATVKQMVELQGGTVAVASKEGAGSSFAVWLPLRAFTAHGPDRDLETTDDAGKIGDSHAARPNMQTRGSTLHPAHNGAESHSRSDHVDAARVAAHAGFVVEPGNAAANGENTAVRVGARTDRNVAAPPKPNTAAPSVKDHEDDASDGTTKSSVPPAESAQHWPGASARSEERTALVIEDDSKAAEVLQVLLEVEGFRVLVASNGAEALEVALGQSLSLIALEIRSPGTDGWGILTQLHEQRHLTAVPIVIVAGDAEVSLVLTNGAGCVLENPIRRADLQQSLDAVHLSPDAQCTRRVLVADDDPETVAVLSRYMSKPRYAIEGAATTDAAIDMVRKLRPDLVLLNPSMQKSNGYQIASALQRDETTAHIPVLLITGSQRTNHEVLENEGDPPRPLSLIGSPNFNRTAFVDEIRRALKSGDRRAER